MQYRDSIISVVFEYFEVLTTAEKKLSEYSIYLFFISQRTVSLFENLEENTAEK